MIMVRPEQQRRYRHASKVTHGLIECRHWVCRAGRRRSTPSLLVDAAIMRNSSSLPVRPAGLGPDKPGHSTCAGRQTSRAPGQMPVPAPDRRNACFHRRSPQNRGLSTRRERARCKHPVSADRLGPQQPAQTRQQSLAPRSTPGHGSCLPSVSTLSAENATRLRVSVNS